METGEAVSEAHAPGWYDFHGGQRYFDGGEWTSHIVPPPPEPPKTLTQSQVAVAVAVGLVLGWIVIWALAQAAPDTFYVPVKFVAKELPALR